MNRIKRALLVFTVMLPACLAGRALGFVADKMLDLARWADRRTPAPAMEEEDASMMAIARDIARREAWHEIDRLPAEEKERFLRAWERLYPINRT
jgi:hypothetical protein